MVRSRLAVACACAAGLATALPPAASAERVPGRVVVGFERDAGAADRDVVRDRVDATVAATVGGARTQVLEVDGPVRAAVRRLAGDPRVRWAEPEYVVEGARVPSDRLFRLQWGLANTGQDGGFPGFDIGAAGAWDVTTGSAGVTVAVVDSGAGFDLPEFAGRWAANAVDTTANGVDEDGNGFVDDVRGWDFQDGDADPTDPGSGHGTQVTGVLAANGDDGTGVAGVDWAARVLPVRILDAEARGTTALLAAGLDYAARSGARVVNASLNGPARSQAVADVIAAHPETLFVVAAGNAGQDVDAAVTPSWPCNEPAANVLCVTAVTNTGAIPAYANTGATSVDLVAPGERVATTALGGGFVFASGSSLATPFVSGIASLALAVRPSSTVAQLRAAVLEGAVPLAAAGGRTASGRSASALGALAAVYGAALEGR